MTDGIEPALSFIVEQRESQCQILQTVELVDVENEIFVKVWTRSVTDFLRVLDSYDIFRSKTVPVVNIEMLADQNYPDDGIVGLLASPEWQITSLVEVNVQSDEDIELISALISSSNETSFSFDRN